MLDCGDSGSQRCGIVAAKGLRGPPSFIAALFRMTELTSGRIVIDGQDIAQLGLVRLRRAMSVLPQQPVLFAGSVRKNLDPLSLHSDDDVRARCCLRAGARPSPALVQHRCCVC